MAPTRCFEPRGEACNVVCFQAATSTDEVVSPTMPSRPGVAIGGCAQTESVDIRGADVRKTRCVEAGRRQADCVCERPLAERSVLR